ncbi:MAG: macro domain-containing protein [Thermoplasmatota archaeon]
MEIMINKTILQLILGDITHETTEAIVNAANSRLAGGGGVDGAIHTAGGPGIMKECIAIGGCPTGHAVITTAGRLPSRYVIHAVGPIYRDGKHNEAALLKSAYHESLKLTSAEKITSISFSAISAGVYGYPLAEAASIALSTIIDYLKEHDDITLIRFVLFHSSIYTIFAEELEKLKKDL